MIGDGTKRKAEEEKEVEPFEVKENKPEIAEYPICLDWHNSDLNPRITDSCMSVIPFFQDGCYAGARATAGFTSSFDWRVGCKQELCEPDAGRGWRVLVLLQRRGQDGPHEGVRGEVR